MLIEQRTSCLDGRKSASVKSVLTPLVVSSLLVLGSYSRGSYRARMSRSSVLSLAQPAFKPQFMTLLPLLNLLPCGLYLMAQLRQRSRTNHEHLALCCVSLIILYSLSIAHRRHGFLLYYEDW